MFASPSSSDTSAQQPTSPPVPPPNQRLHPSSMYAPPKEKRARTEPNTDIEEQLSQLAKDINNRGQFKVICYYDKSTKKIHKNGTSDIYLTFNKGGETTSPSEEFIARCKELNLKIPGYVVAEDPPSPCTVV